MPGGSTRPLVDRLLDGKLTAFLTERREFGESYHTIAIALRDTVDVSVTAETIRQWCFDLGIEERRAGAVDVARGGDA